jgi:TonB family protein
MATQREWSLAARKTLATARANAYPTPAHDAPRTQPGKVIPITSGRRPPGQMTATTAEKQASPTMQAAFISFSLHAALVAAVCLPILHAYRHTQAIPLMKISLYFEHKPLSYPGTGDAGAADGGKGASAARDAGSTRHVEPQGDATPAPIVHRIVSVSPQGVAPSRIAQRHPLLPVPAVAPPAPTVVPGAAGITPRPAERNALLLLWDRWTHAGEAAGVTGRGRAGDGSGAGTGNGQGNGRGNGNGGGQGGYGGKGLGGGAVLIPMFRPCPAYPEIARREKHEGSVQLKGEIAPNGIVRTLRVFATSGFWELDEAAILAFRRWRFRALPATEPWTITARFVLDNHQAAGVGPAAGPSFACRVVNFGVTPSLR